MPHTPESSGRAAMRTERGVTGLTINNGIVQEEFLPQLAGPKAVKVWREMSTNNATIRASLLLYKLLIGDVDWDVTPASEDAQDVERAEWLRSVMDDMSHSWSHFVFEASTMLEYGHSVFEVVVKDRQGPDAKVPSRHDDGLVGIRKLAYRAQSSIQQWAVDEHGGITGLVQQAPTGALIPLPIEKLLLFRLMPVGNNPEGTSILRSAYPSFWYHKRITEFEAIGVERDATGIAKFSVDPDLFVDEARASELEQYKKAATSLRTNEQAGVVLPAIYDEHGNKIYDFELVRSPGSKQYDSDKIIARHTRDMVMAMLADILLLGHEKVGTQALAETKKDLLTAGIASIVSDMADVLNRHLVPKLIRLNGWDPEGMPQFTPSEARDVDVEAFTTAIWRLSQAGMPMFPSLPLEEHVRSQMGWPQMDDEEMAVRADMDALAANVGNGNGDGGDGDDGGVAKAAAVVDAIRTSDALVEKDRRIAKLTADLKAAQERRVRNIVRDETGRAVAVEEGPADVG